MTQRQGALLVYSFLAEPPFARGAATNALVNPAWVLWGDPMCRWRYARCLGEAPSLLKEESRRSFGCRAASQGQLGRRSSSAQWSSARARRPARKGEKQCAIIRRHAPTRPPGLPQHRQACPTPRQPNTCAPRAAEASFRAGRVTTVASAPLGILPRRATAMKVVGSRVVSQFAKQTLFRHLAPRASRRSSAQIEPPRAASSRKSDQIARLHHLT